MFRSYNFEELSDTPLIQEDHAIMSFITDNSDRYALLNIATQGVHMWDIRARYLRKLRFWNIYPQLTFPGPLFGSLWGSPKASTRSIAALAALTNPS